MCMVPSKTVHCAQYFHRLAWKRYDMLFSLFHAFSGNAPDCRVKIEFAPLRANNFIGAAQRQPHEPDGSDGLKVTVIAVQVAQELPNFHSAQRTLVLRLIGR